MDPEHVEAVEAVGDFDPPLMTFMRAHFAQLLQQPSVGLADLGDAPPVWQMRCVEAGDLLAECQIVRSAVRNIRCVLSASDIQ